MRFFKNGTSKSWFVVFCQSLTIPDRYLWPRAPYKRQGNSKAYTSLIQENAAESLIAESNSHVGGQAESEQHDEPEREDGGSSDDHHGSQTGRDDNRVEEP
jgi:hypothetical protein